MSLATSNATRTVTEQRAHDEATNAAVMAENVALRNENADLKRALNLARRIACIWHQRAVRAGWFRVTVPQPREA